MSRFLTANAGGVCRIVFDDGGMNLLSRDALDELRAAVSTAPRKASLVVLESGRPRLFAAGADMTEMERFGPVEADALARKGQEVFDALSRLPIASVVLIDGDCFGGAVDFALAFDVRLATPRARFSHPGARIGIVTGYGGTTRWRGTLCRGHAGPLFLGNGILSAVEAQRIGLVDRISDDPEMCVRQLQSRSVVLGAERTARIAELAHHGAGTGLRNTLGMARALAELHSFER